MAVTLENLKNRLSYFAKEIDMKVSGNFDTKTRRYQNDFLSIEQA